MCAPCGDSPVVHACLLSLEVVLALPSLTLGTRGLTFLVFTGVAAATGLVANVLLISWGAFSTAARGALEMVIAMYAAAQVAVSIWSAMHALVFVQRLRDGVQPDNKEHTQAADMALDGLGAAASGFLVLLPLIVACTATHVALQSERDRRATAGHKQVAAAGASAEAAAPPRSGGGGGGGGNENSARAGHVAVHIPVAELVDKVELEL